MALWLVLVTLELNQGEYGAAAWCRKASTDFRTLLDHLGLFRGSEMTDFGAVEVGRYSILHSLRVVFLEYFGRQLSG